MERSPHVALHGCDAWLEQQGLEQCAPDWFDTEARRKQLEDAKKGSGSIAPYPRSCPIGRSSPERLGARAALGGGGDPGAGRSPGPLGAPVPNQAEACREPSVAVASPGRNGAEADGLGAGTVGAVVLDAHGNLVAASSTGGMTNKWSGRIGDTPCIGDGTFACPSCAVSCSGTGEQFMRQAAAAWIGARVEVGIPLGWACETMVYSRLEPGDGGLIALDREGNFSAPFSTEGFFHGFMRASDSEPKVAIWSQAQ